MNRTHASTHARRHNTPYSSYRIRSPKTNKTTALWAERAQSNRTYPFLQKRIPIYLIQLSLASDNRHSHWITGGIRWIWRLKIVFVLNGHDTYNTGRGRMNPERTTTALCETTTSIATNTRTHMKQFASSRIASLHFTYRTNYIDPAVD